MRFLVAHWLWGLAVLPFLYLLASWEEARRRRQLSSFIDPILWKQVLPEHDPGARMRKARIWLLAVAFALLALARPQWGKHEETLQVSGLDIMLVLDVSNSMEVEDVPPSRLKKAKHLIRTLVDKLKGDRVGVVAFAGSSYVASPLTTDTEYAVEAVDLLVPRMVLNQGTDIGLGLETARKSLERGAEEPANTRENGNRKVDSQAVILISDGEDHEEAALQAADEFRKAGIKLYVLGVGTEKGGPVPLRDETGALQGFKRDLRGQPVVSSFKPEALLGIAAAGGGKYWNVTANETEVDELLADMGALSRTDYAEKRIVVYQDRYQYPLAVAVLLLVLELSLALKRPVARAAGSVVLAVIAGGGLQGCLPSLQDYTENEKGVQAFQEGKIDEAKRRFGEAQARNPESPELRFNQGAVQAQEGDAESAIQSYSGTAREALRKGDAALAGKGLFNLGALLSKKGDLKGAVEAYLGAIEAARRSKDPTLEQEARKNIELLLQQQQQQKQQQKQQQQQQQQQEQKKKEEQEQQQQQQKQEQQDKKDQEKYEKTQKQKFRSAKLSDEDAERVMAELKNRERQLQQRLKKQNGRPQSSAQKDW
ncbi:MAG: VWA domain-containing protein [Oligoflexia bacterium]|nr:VWA domain-containing protein [Oligoflexia bacterium]